VKTKEKKTQASSRAYSYVRWSTPEQSHGDSSRRQTEAARRYCGQHGLTLDESTYRDAGISAFSGKNVESGALGQFLEAARAGIVPSGSTLLIEKLDRLTRLSPPKGLALLSDLCDLGITVVTLGDGRAHTAESIEHDHMGTLMSYILLIRGREESETKSERVGAAWQNKRDTAAKTPLTKRTPGWITLDSKSGTLKLIPERAKIVRQIFQWALKGIGTWAIARRLNTTGVKPFGRSSEWQRSYVVKLLRFKAVIGIYEAHRKVAGRRQFEKDVPDYYPRAVEQDVWNRVQSLLRSTSPLRGRHAGNDVQSLFGGLARCPRCSGIMTRVNKGGKPLKNGTPGKIGIYLACASAKQSGKDCTYHAVRYEPVEAAFLREADRVLNDAPAGDPSIDQAVENAENVLLALHDQVEKVLDAITQHGISAALSKRLLDVEQEVEAARTQLADLQQQQADASEPLVARKIADLKVVLGKKPLDRAAANALLRQLFSGVVVDYTGKSQALTLQWKQGGETLVVYGMKPLLSKKGKAK
jgi:DNA invertase Pin-like site-specific DNA recombinase